VLKNKRILWESSWQRNNLVKVWCNLLFFSVTIKRLKVIDQPKMMCKRIRSITQDDFEKLVSGIPRQDFCKIVRDLN